MNRLIYQIMIFISIVKLLPDFGVYIYQDTIGFQPVELYSFVIWSAPFAYLNANNNEFYFLQIVLMIAGRLSSVLLEVIKLV